MTSSRSVSLSGAQEPRVAVVPRARDSDGDDACFLASAYGLTPDPWQYNVIEGWLGRRGDGRWAASTVACAVPRQNGKNGIIEVVELYFMVGLGLKILHTAHEVKTARKAFIRLCSFFENEREYPELAALVKDIRRTNGQEAILLNNGGSVEFIARSKGSGRGFTVDILVCDEAQELADDALEALTPTTSAAPSGDPLAIFTGTPPSPTMQGDVWTRIRASALDGTDKRVAWFEWSAVGDVDLDDRSIWAATNPALGTRLNIETLEAERARFSGPGFARERLGMWASERSLAVIPLDDWDARSRPEPASGKPDYFSLTMSAERYAAIGVAIVTGEEVFVDLAELDRADDPRALVSWLSQRCGRRIPVAIDARDPAASLVNELRQAGVKVNVFTAADSGKACGSLLDAVSSERIWHIGQPAVRQALTAAKKKQIGKAGLWEWDLEDPSAEMAALRAITFAHFGSTFAKKRSNRVVMA